MSTLADRPQIGHNWKAVRMGAGLNQEPWAMRLAAMLALALVAGACGGGDAQPGVTVETADTPTTVAASDGGPDAAGTEQPTSTTLAGELVVPVDTTTTLLSEDGLEPAEPEPQFGGTLRVGVEAESDGLNPAANNFAVSAYVMTFPIFDQLAFYDKQGNWVPYLAEEFTKIGDGTEWQMKLREGVLFHDGTELDADDVIATFEAQLADPVISLAVRPSFDPEAPIAKIDKYTVQYKGIRPAARFPIVLTSQLGMVLPSEWLERALEDPALNQVPVGQGPFMIESRTQDEVTVLVRDPNYWAADRTDIYLDRIEVYPITDTAIAAERLAAGDLDLIVTSNAQATLTLREADDVSVVENVRSSERFSVINTERPPFDDIRARQAITFASDRDAYVALIREDNPPMADTMFHPDLIWHNPEVKQETNMPERAGPLVESYCSDFPENCSGGKIDMEYSYSGPSSENDLIAALLTDSWEDYFNVSPQQHLQDTFITSVVLGSYQVANWRQFGSVDPDNDILWLSCATVGFISLNFPRVCSDDRDALMYEAQASEDRDTRVALWHRVQENIRDSYSYIFWHHTNWVIGTRNNVENVCGQESPDGTELWCNNQGRVQLHQVWLS